MKAIVQRSCAIVTFVGLLGLTLSAPQRQHVERLGDLLVVAPRRKTLAQLAALELPGVDASNLADFFRISPWDADDLRLPLFEFVIGYLKGRNGDPACPIYLTIDDSLTAKDKGTRRLESVDWHFDHNQKRAIKAGSHVVLRIHWGPFHFPLSWRPYLRESTVRRLNRRRKNPRLRYRSKLGLAREMLQQVVSSLPKTNPVYVLFDSWYTSAKLVKWIRQQGWHVIAAIKSNRKLSGRKLTDWHHDLKGRSYDRVSLELANKKQRTYCVRQVTGRLRGVPGIVRVLLSQKGPGVRSPEVFPVYRREIVGAGDAEALSASLGPGSRLLVREIAIGLGGFPVTQSRGDQQVVCRGVLGARVLVLAKIRVPRGPREDHESVGSIGAATRGSPTGGVAGGL